MAELTKESAKNEELPKMEKNWPRVLFQLYIHASFVYGSFFLLEAKYLTLAFTLGLMSFGLLGITAGAHRFWAHKSYSASTVLKIFLMICHTVSGCGTIYDWVLSHRIHHKYHGTNDDPFNYKRGFFYAHIGSRTLAQNPKWDELVKEIDMTDLENDKVVMFQKRFYWFLMPVMALLLTINAPVEYWGENMMTSLMVTGCFRISLMLHATWLVNSARSIWGLLPGDRFYSESNLIFLIKKSHWHQYHYTVPWDCMTGEFGSYNSGCTTAFIKIWTVMGLASDIKTIDSKGVARALENAIDTGKSIGNCISEARDENELYQYEDNTLGIIETKQSRPN